MKFLIYCKNTFDVISKVETPSKQIALDLEDETQGVIDVDDFPVGNHQYIDGKLVKGSSAERLSKQLESLKANALLKIEGIARRSISQVSRIDAQSQQVYEKQADEARAFLDNGAEGQLLRSMAKAKGVPAKALAKVWIKKNEEYHAALARAAVLQSRAKREISRVTSKQEITQIIDAAKADLSKG